jgi:hypothetical protein
VAVEKLFSRDFTIEIRSQVIESSFAVGGEIHWECSPDDPDACAEASKLRKILLWASAAIYAVGFFVAFIMGPILSKLDNA